MFSSVSSKSISIPKLENIRSSLPLVGIGVVAFIVLGSVAWKYLTFDENSLGSGRTTPLPDSGIPRSILSRIFNRSVDLPQGLRGIHNQGNTCFMNATFQLIMNNKELARAIEETYAELVEKGGDNLAVYRSVLKAIDSYRKGESPDLEAIRPLCFDAVELNSMGDATEFLSALLAPIDRSRYPNLFITVESVRTYQAVEGTCEEKIKLDIAKKQNQSLTEEQIADRYTILSQDLKAIKLEPKASIIIPLANPDSQKLTMEAMGGQPNIVGILNGKALIKNEILKEELMTESIATVCKQENTYGLFRPIHQRVEMQKLPPHLMVQLGRFDFINGELEKINTEVSIPLVLQLTAGDGQANTYQLKSIVEHVGAHYISYICKENQWYKMDDSVVTPLSISEVILAARRGYIFDYEKTNT